MDDMDVTRSRKPVCRSFSRLVVIIKLILRIFTPKVMLVQESRGVNSSVKKPTMLELSATISKRKLSERIQQRLLRRPSLTPQDDVVDMSSSVICCEIQNILVTPPWNRSSEQLEKAYKELQTCRSFNDLPVGVQKSICKLGWYQLLEANRVIYSAGYEPTCYYMLLSGSVIEVDGSVQSAIGSIVNVYNNGSSFGDSAIVDGTCRATSCYAKEQVELLVVSKSDYVDLSLRQARKSYQDIKHFMFCRTVLILKHWPLDELSAENCSQCYYKSGAVIVKDSKKCDNIFVVMSVSEMMCPPTVKVST